MSERYPELDEVLAFIHNNLYEPMELSKLAEYAAYSPYHFARIFKERVGLPPLYFVSALRLQKAKELLLNTHLSVRDIGLEIGQQSLGTFTTRFTEKVGVTPAQFRESAERADGQFQTLREITKWDDCYRTSNIFSVVEGAVGAVQPFEGVVLVGLFKKPIPEGLPIYGTLLSSLGRFRFTDVTPGTYYIMATSVSWNMQAKDFLVPSTNLRVRSMEPVVVTGQGLVQHQHLILHPPLHTDPPILISLPVLMSQFINERR